MGKAFASIPRNIFPGMGILAAHPVGQGKVCGKDVVSPVALIAGDGHIPHPPISIIRPENGLAVVKGLPVETVPAQGKAYLFSVWGSCFPEMDK